MIILIRLYLLMRIITFLVQKTVQVASNHLILVKVQGKVMSLIIVVLAITLILSIILVIVSF